MVKKLGRPKIEIDWEILDKLCGIQCTLTEIADWFGCSEDTIERRCKSDKKMLFAEYFKKKSVTGKISLRRNQFKSSDNGNVTMQIWLGKQYLGQREQPIYDEGEMAQPIKVEIVSEDGRRTNDQS